MIHTKQTLVTCMPLNYRMNAYFINKDGKLSFPSDLVTPRDSDITRCAMRVLYEKAGMDVLLEDLRYLGEACTNGTQKEFYTCVRKHKNNNPANIVTRPLSDIRLKELTPAAADCLRMFKKTIIIGKAYRAWPDHQQQFLLRMLPDILRNKAYQ